MIVVFKQNNKWVVVEGNRRITALKLLNYPNLCKDSKKKDKILTIIQNAKQSIPKVINAITHDNKKEIYKYIELRHTGENEGRGIIPWGAKEKDRFRVTQKSQPQNKFSYQVLELLDIMGENISDIKITTLERILNDTAFRQDIGLQVVKKQLLFTSNPLQVLDILKFLIQQINLNHLKVKKVYSKIDRELYLKELKEDKIIPDVLETLPQPISFNDYIYREKKTDKAISPSIENITNKVNPINKAPYKTSDSRDYLIEKSTSISIPKEHRKARDIFIELRSKIKVSISPIAVAMLLRSLIELSVYKYINSNNLNKSDTFGRTLNKAASNMYKNNKITKDYLNNIERVVNNKIITIKDLHGFVHNDQYFPSAQELNILWNNIEKYLYLLGIKVY